MFRFPEVMAMRAPMAKPRAILGLFRSRNRKLKIINKTNMVYRALFHHIFDNGLAEKTPYISTLHGLSTSRPIVSNPANIAVMARNTVLLMRGINALIRKICPREEMMQRPVERQAKKTYGVIRIPQGTSRDVPKT
jgi:hypothetical protein